MVKEEPSFNIWGEISDSEFVLEVAKVEQNTNNNKKNVASRVISRETSQETKNKCYCKKTNRPQFSMVYTLIDHRNDAIKCSKLCIETTRLRVVVSFEF